MTPHGSVLILDPSSENREVLRTALARRGVSILEASRTELAIDLARQHHPDLIVLDLEALALDSSPTASDIQSASDHPPSMVLLGTAQQREANWPADQFVTKPYHYGPLILRIERLLEQARQAVQRFEDKRISPPKV